MCIMEIERQRGATRNDTNNKTRGAGLLALGPFHHIMLSKHCPLTVAPGDLTTTKRREGGVGRPSLALGYGMSDWGEEKPTTTTK